MTTSQIFSSSGQNITKFADLSANPPDVNVLPGQPSPYMIKTATYVQLKASAMTRVLSAICLTEPTARAIRAICGWLRSARAQTTQSALHSLLSPPSHWFASV